MSLMIQGITLKNWKDLRWFEDSYEYDEKEGLMAVADGITRDPKNMPILPNRKDLAGMIKFFWNYPGSKLKFWKKEISPARMAADEFCRSFIYYMKEFEKKDAKAVRDSFEKANEEIKILNEEYNPVVDYLENDYWGCVAAGCALRHENGQKVLSYGFIADCGISVFDANGNKKFQTLNEGPNSKGSINRDIKEKYGAEFRFPEGRRIIRNLYRNNPEEPLAYGALTGEKSAMKYVRTGELEIERGDKIIVFTDGLEDIVNHEDFPDSIELGYFNSMINFCRKNIRKEGTLVYLAKD